MKNARIVNLPKLASLAVAALLVSCASATPVPQIVKVPVYVPCVAGVPIVKPDFEFAKLAPAASDGDKVLALARDWPRGRAYEGLLEAVVLGCR